MATNTYAKTDKTKLTKNFNISEFHCMGTSCGCEETLHDPALSDLLQQIRDHFGKPIHITSGYRCPKHNAAVGGTANSRHAKGQAADFYISGVETAKIAAYAESIGVLGIGLYADFVHIDTRSTKSFWFGHGQEYRESFGGTNNTLAVYLVTCRVNGSKSLHTLLFDGTVGNYIQPIPDSSAGIKMVITDDEASFSSICIDTETVEIMHVRKLEK